MQAVLVAENTTTQNLPSLPQEWYSWTALYLERLAEVTAFSAQFVPSNNRWRHATNCQSAHGTACFQCRNPVRRSGIPRRLSAWSGSWT